MFTFLCGEISLLSANLLPEHYVYPTSNPAAVSIIPYPGFGSRERLGIVVFLKQIGVYA